MSKVQVNGALFPAVTWVLAEVFIMPEPWIGATLAVLQDVPALRTKQFFPSPSHRPPHLSLVSIFP